MDQIDRSFQKIFLDYYNPLVNFINGYLNNPEDSKEVVQNVFMKLWEVRESLHFQVSVKSFIYQSAKNAMIDYIRAGKKHRGHLDIDNEGLNNLAQAGEEKLDPYIIRAEIEHVLLQLKPKAREIFTLSKFEGLTYEEIADYLRISKRSVEDNIAKTMAVLQERLKNNPNLFF